VFPPKKEKNNFCLSRAEDDQVWRDVIRTPNHILQCAEMIQSNDGILEENVGTILNHKRNRLKEFICRILKKSKGKFHYYQGFNDVASIFLNVLQENDDDTMDLAVNVLFHICNSHLHDSMKADFISLRNAMKLTIYPLIQVFDSTIHTKILKCSVDEPFFALSWIITWFAHDLKDTCVVKQIYDAILASHPLFVIYLSVAMVLHPQNRRILLSYSIKSEKDENFANMYNLLSSLPSCKRAISIPVQDLINSAIMYM